MADLIDRQAAIDAMGKAKWAKERLMELPTVQPDHVADVSKKVEAKDCISRQAAIDTIMGQPPEPHYPSWYAAQIEKIPAAQPDHTADVSKKVSISCAHENDVRRP